MWVPSENSNSKFIEIPTSNDWWIQDCMIYIQNGKIFREEKYIVLESEFWKIERCVLWGEVLLSTNSTSIPPSASLTQVSFNLSAVFDVKLFKQTTLKFIPSNLWRWIVFCFVCFSFFFIEESRHVARSVARRYTTTSELMEIIKCGCSKYNRTWDLFVFIAIVLHWNGTSLQFVRICYTLTSVCLTWIHSSYELLTLLTDKDGIV